MEEQLYVNILRTELGVLLGADEACKFSVEYCAKEELDLGMNWKALVRACDIEKTILFYVDNEDSEYMPRELRLSNDGQYNAAKAVIGLGNRDEYTTADTDLYDIATTDSGEEYPAVTADEEVLDEDDESMDGILLDNGFTACPLILDQVCCNDITYDNKCVARVAGVNVLTDCTRGACVVVTDAPVVAADDVEELVETPEDDLDDVTAPTEKAEETVDEDVELESA